MRNQDYSSVEIREIAFPIAPVELLARQEARKKGKRQRKKEGCMFTYPGNIDGGQNFSHTDDDDILIQGKIDGGSTVTLVSNGGSVTIEGKIDGGSRVTLSAARDVQIGVVGWPGDKKIDGGSNVSVNAGGSISLGNKIDNGSTNVLFRAGTGIDIGNKIDGGATVRLSTGSGTIHIHDKIDGSNTHVTYWPPNSLLVDNGIRNGVIEVAPS